MSWAAAQSCADMSPQQYKSYQRDKMGMFLETGGSPPAVSPRESSLQLSGIFLTHCLLLLPQPCSGVGPVQSLWAREAMPCRCGEPPVPSRQGCVAATCVFLRMIEHLHPSVVNGPSSFPASLASAYLSPAALDQPIHHTDWCSPHQFSCSPCPNLS